MSKDNTNLRLLGSPVNLSYRGKRNNRNRPRSALQSSCSQSYVLENPEKYKRPFSADTKERAPSTRSFFKTFSAELLQTHSNPPVVTALTIVPPTTELLGDSKSYMNQVPTKDKEICSNASDHGSEDTFVSLGTKIKARAQLVPKTKTPNAHKNILKYRNIAKRGRKLMDNTHEDKGNNDYGLEIKITERPQSSPSPSRAKARFRERSLSPSFKTRAYESYFIPLDARKADEDALVGRVSFGSSDIQSEVEQAIDTYSRRLSVTKQQLSLVEEESAQDIESVPSHNMSSLSPEISMGDSQRVENGENGLTGRKTYIVDINDEDYPKTTQNFNELRTYSSFYDDFRTQTDPYKSKMSSTMVHTDSSSKDSGYPESGVNDDRPYRLNYSLPSTSVLTKSNSHDKLEDQPKSLDSISTNSNDKGHSIDKSSQWVEPLNHSRLLYKDFFLKKEGHIALPPQNSPNNATIDTRSIPGTNEIAKIDKENDQEYPPYLLNSTTKAYTSKVIEDYKKELEAINSLHELTLKDIKTDAISPTPYNIDKMFEQHSSLDDKHEPSENQKRVSQETTNVDGISNRNNKNSLDKYKRDISKVSTKELIQNYLKVKEGDYEKHYVSKNIGKFDRKCSHSSSKLEGSSDKYDWNNKNSKPNTPKSPIPVNIKNPTQKNMFTLRTPLSARIESVQTDKDIDSWMSLSAPSPRVVELDHMESTEVKSGTKPSTEPNRQVSEEKVEVKAEPPPPPTVSSKERDSTKDLRSNSKNSSPNSKDVSANVKDLNSNSTVLDIYSMLKEIESYGDNPVTSVAKHEEINAAESKQDDRPYTPKDNFMEIFEFLEKVEQSANDALSVVTSSTPQTTPKLEVLLKLPQTELAQRLVTASLQLEERSCCIALLQESLANHKEQMINKVSSLEKQSLRNVAKVKQDCEETIKRHQVFIDQLINDKKTLNHRIEQLVDERRSLEERWRRSAQALEERYKLELRNQHDKMAAAQQVARQRWVRQKAEKIKELTVKGLEGELREMAERQQKEISDLKMYHAEHTGRLQAKHAAELEELRRRLEDEKEAALVKERHLASTRCEKQILELELSYQEQRTRLVAEMRAENERVASGLSEKERTQREEIEKWKEEQEKHLAEKRLLLEQDIVRQKQHFEEQLKQKERELELKFEEYKKSFEAEQQVILKRKVTEIAAQHKQERDRKIEQAIESMEAEAQSGRKELQDALRRNKEQYELELKELAETEQATLRRYQDAQARVRQTEDRCAELEVTINQLTTRNKILHEKNSELEGQTEQIRARCEEAWRTVVDNLKREAEDTRKTHDEQMHQLYAKVKVAVARKDSAIQALTREAAKYQEKITLLEQKLQQQRKDFLKQK